MGATSRAPDDRIVAGQRQRQHGLTRCRPPEQVVAPDPGDNETSAPTPSTPSRGTAARRRPAHLAQDHGDLGEGGAGAVECLRHLQAQPSRPGGESQSRGDPGPARPSRSRATARAAVVDLAEVPHQTAGSRGSPRPRSPMIVRWISLVPPGIVHSHEPMKSSTQAPDSQPARHRLLALAWAGARDLGAEVRHALQQLAVVQLDDRRLGRPTPPAGRGRRPRRSSGRSRPPRSRARPDGPARVLVAAGRRAAGSTAQARRASGTRRDEPLGQLDIVDAPLGAQRALGHLPAVVLRADAVRRRDGHLVEEDLAEVRLAGGLADRADVDAGGAHVHQEGRDALALRRRRGRCGRAAGTSRPRGPARPDLLARDDVVSPSRAGARPSAARSEPASGSEKPWHQISRRGSAGRRRACCSGDPAWRSRARRVDDAN